MACLTKSSIRAFRVISLLVLLELVPVFAAAISSCSSPSGEHAVIDHLHGLNDTVLEERLPNRNLKKFRSRPVRDHHSSGEILLKGPRLAIGMTAELIRYHRHSTAAAGNNSSELFLEIKRSLARARRIKISKGWKGGRVSAQDSNTKSNVTAGAQSSPAAGMHTDLSSGAPFEYLMKMSIGTPPQHLVAVADTGSDLVWLQCTPPVPSCDMCFPTSDDHFFDPSRSQTFSNLSCKSKPCQRAMHYRDWVSCSSNCKYSYFYADNSNTTGDLAMDTIQMKTSTAFGELVNMAVHDVAFGCGQNQFSTSMLYFAANGVVGLGKGPLSLPSQLGAQFGKKFSYCLVDRKQSGVKSSPILFGDVAVPRTAGLQYTPFIENPEYPTYYYIGLEKIDVGGKALDIPSSAFELDFSPDNAGDGGTVIDSGTTYTQLVAPAYTALLQALSSRISYERVAGYFDFCHDVTRIAEELIVVPSISWHFRGGAKLILPFQNAFILVHDDPVPGKTTMCLAINNSTDTGFTIIGNYQQSNFHILYDLQKKRLGFVPRNC